jgi:hypothetical protein
MKDRGGHEEILAPLRRLARPTAVPPPDAAQEAALLREFDRRRLTPAEMPRSGRRLAGVWWLPALSGAVALLLTAVVPPRVPGRRAASPPGDRAAAHGTAASAGVRASEAVGEFISLPGASSLPPLESGELVRMDLPVSMLPSLGVAPPAGHVTAVRADVVIGQDGLARAVRFVGN